MPMMPNTKKIRMAKMTRVLVVRLLRMGVAFIRDPREQLAVTGMF
jgi:hypothetical protein